MRVSSIFKAAKWERRFDHSAPRPGKDDEEGAWFYYPPGA
jgi:hypothetical protein